MKSVRNALFVLCGALMPVAALAEEAGGEDVGFPQLRQANTFAGQVFWLTVSFLVLYALMSVVALPRVASVIEARKKDRRDKLKEAESLNHEAERIKKNYEASLSKAQGAALDLMRSTEQGIAERIAEESARFATEARERLGDAEGSIRRAKQDAMASLPDIAADIAADMAARIAGVQVSKAEAKAAVTGLKE